MKLFLTKTFLRSYKRVVAKRAILKNKIKQKLELLTLNPLHPTLRLHKLKGKKNDAWSITVESDLRIIFTYVSDGILLVDIGKHDEVY